MLLSAVGAREARTAAEHLLAEIRSSSALYGAKPFRITASIGVATFESDDATAGEVLVNADLAMYAAKTSGRDRVVVYTATEARKGRAMAKLTWSQRIQDALEHGRFVLHLQPILELASGQNYKPRPRTPFSSHPRWWASSWRSVRVTCARSRSGS